MVTKYLYLPPSQKGKNETKRVSTDFEDEVVDFEGENVIHQDMKSSV